MGKRRSPKRILVVEDDDLVRQLMRMTLENQGYSVATAEDGRRGYDVARDLKPDLIITDVNMPDVDGVDLVRRIRETEGIAEIPILVITGYGTGRATFTLTQGADAYEPKPIEPKSLLMTVERLLEGKRSA